jgi:hypothetical protein
MISIWVTIEAEAWSRSLRYSDYLNLHKRNGSNPLGEEAYKLLCQAFDKDMEEDFLEH